MDFWYVTTCRLTHTY